MFTALLCTGAYGLPLLRTSPGYKLYDDTEAGFCFEHPRGWIKRKNTQRQGVYIADFQARRPSHPVPRTCLCASGRTSLACTSTGYLAMSWYVSMCLADSSGFLTDRLNI